jgi:hypothetical protein
MLHFGDMRLGSLRKPWFFAVLIIILSLIVASCGGSKETTQTPPPGGGTTGSGGGTGTGGGGGTGSGGGGGGQGSTIPSVVRWHYDLAGTGNNDKETILTPANVSSPKFGKLFDITGLDGAVYAQPLYVPELTVNGAKHNVLFLGTQHDMLYAYDADSSGPALWSRQLIDKTNGETYLDNPAVDTGKICCPDHAIGIVGTPVIDQSTNTLYVVARTKKDNPRSYYQGLYAIDITNGQTKAVKEIQASVPGNGDSLFFPDSPNTLVFDRPYDRGGPGDKADGIVESHHNQRGGLLLLGNQVFVTWGSHTDIHPYHGWVMAFDKTSLNLNVALCITPNDNERAGGIWMSGAAPASDGTNIYLATGNGDYNPGHLNYAQSLLRLNQNLTIADHFTPFNWDTLNQTDLDLAASAPIVLPDQSGAHPHMLLMTGKEGTIYLVDRDNMGKFQAGSDSQIVQRIQQALPGIVRSAPAYWNGFVYYAAGIVTNETPGATPDQYGKMDVLRAYKLENGQLSTQPVMKGTQQFFFPGATPWISSNGTSNAIVWAVRNPSGGGAAILDAYDATNLNLLFSATPGTPNQTGGSFTRFVLPVVVNGKVYVASSNGGNEVQGRISVYGLKP